MHKRSSNKRGSMDINVLAANIVEKATKPRRTKVPASSQGKNPAAVALGRLGGLKSGKARADKLTSARRVETAKISQAICRSCV